MLRTVSTSCAALAVLATQATAEPDVAISYGVDLMDTHVPSNVAGQLDDHEVVAAVENIPQGAAAFWIIGRDGQSRQAVVGSAIFEGESIVVSSTVADESVEVLLMNDVSVSLQGGDTLSPEADYRNLGAGTPKGVLRSIFDFTTRSISRGDERQDTPIGSLGFRG